MKTRTHKSLLLTTGASFSDCERYRYTLWRTWGTGPTINFIMLNPSTADERVNDPTIERCQRRADKLGYGGLIVTNLFALRATDPDDMLRDAAPVGPENDDAIRESACQANQIVCAWGNHGSHLGRGAMILTMLRNFCPHKLHALKVSKSGQPSHPLYLSYDLMPVPFQAP